jgi:heme A synthase
VADPVPTPDRRPAPRQPGVREVLLVAAAVVALVLAAAALTAVLPNEVQALVFHTPLLIAVLVLGTAVVLWRILRAPSA